VLVTRGSHFWPVICPFNPLDGMSQRASGIAQKKKLVFSFGCLLYSFQNSSLFRGVAALWEMRGIRPASEMRLIPRTHERRSADHQGGIFPASFSSLLLLLAVEHGAVGKEFEMGEAIS